MSTTTRPREMMRPDMTAWVENTRGERHYVWCHDEATAWAAYGALIGAELDADQPTWNGSHWHYVIRVRHYDWHPVETVLDRLMLARHR